jgi:hypothetical protein
MSGMGMTWLGLQSRRLENSRLTPDTSSSHLYSCVISNLFLVMIGGRHSPHAGGRQKSCAGRERLAIDCFARDVPHSPIHPRKKKDAVVPGEIILGSLPVSEDAFPFSLSLSLSQWNNTNVAPAL